jgi:hypothetical protein
LNPLLIGPLSDLIKEVIGRVWPDPEKQAQAQLELLKMQQAGELDVLKEQMSAILAEEQSPDPWTSRARPSFLYVMYILILSSIPMGALYAFYPAVALGIVSGFKQWLSAIPDSLYTLFGVGYLGYTGARTWEKNKGLTK